MGIKSTIVAVMLIVSLLGFSTKAITPLLSTQDSPFQEVVIDTRASAIDTYFRERNMPLEGYGKKMVEVADKYGLDWRLLPAISVRESSGGKKMCENNPFGWGSCRIVFNSINEAIETVGFKLANLSVYKGKTTERKLYHYNGTVLPSYPGEVLAIMNKFVK